MRVGHLQPTRPGWFDRTPGTSILTFNVTVTGGDPTTVRAALTIPTGRKAYLDLAMISAFRTAAATPDARVEIGLRYNNGIAAAFIQWIDTSVTSWGAAGDQWLGQGGILLPGDILDLLTFSSFTDGTMNMLGSVKLTTFDA